MLGIGVGLAKAELASALKGNCCRPMSKMPAALMSQTILTIVSQFFIAHNPGRLQKQSSHSLGSHRAWLRPRHDTVLAQPRDLA
jgi:hypothetical protein